MIKQLRKAEKLTQEELGKKLDPPVNKAAINKWESGIVQNIKRAYILQLASIFGVSPAFLMGFVPSQPQPVLSDDELDLIEAYRSMNAEQKKALHIILDMKSREV